MIGNVVMILHVEYIGIKALQVSLKKIAFQSFADF